MSRKTDRSSAESGATTQPRRRAGLRQLASAAVVIVLFAAVYALSVSNRLQETERHGLDALVQVTESVDDLLANSLKVVDSLTKPGFACEFFERQSHLTLADDATCEQVDEFTLEAKTHYERTRSRRGKQHTQKDPRYGLISDRTLDSHARGFTIDVCLISTSQISEPKESELAQTCTESVGKRRVHIDVNLDEVLDASTFGTAFESILVADRSSHVMVQHAPSALELFQPPGHHIEHQALGVSIGSLTKLMGSDSDDKDDKSSQTADSATTLVSKVELAGARYTLMCQPLDLEAASRQLLVANAMDGAQGSFRVCGLINGGSSLRDSLEVASPLVMAMLAFVLIGIITWPVVKLTTLRARERMHFVEVYVSMLATIAFLMVGTVFLLCTDRALMGNDATRARLAHIAQALEHNLINEFSDAREQLGKLDESLASLGDSWLEACSGTDQPVDQSRLCICDEQSSSEDDQNCSAYAGPNWRVTDILVEPRRDGLSGLARPDIYPFFSQVFLINLKNGMQLLKASARNANTPMVSVGKREYYQAVRDRELWSVENQGGDFFVQSFRSITTGEFSAALSARSVNQWRDIAGEIPKVEAREYDAGLGVAMAFTPLSLVNQVLAPGVSYAVIDNATGRALFHSDVRHATVENLFRDEGIADRLKAAIHARATVTFDGRYRTQANYVHVRPLADIPWTIVLFENASVSRTSSVEVLSQATLMVALHLLALGLLTGLYLANNGRETPSWIWPAAHWPHRDRIALFRGGCWWLVAYGLVSLTAVSIFEGPSLWWSLALPQAAVVVLLFAGAGKALKREYAKTLERLGRWVLMAALIGCFAVSAQSQQMWAQGIPRVTMAFLLLLVLVTLWAWRRDVVVAGAVRWSILVAAAIFIGVVWFADSPTWALWCLIAFFVCYLLMPLSSWRYRLRGYQLRAMLVWLVIAVPPAVGYFKIAHERELNVFQALEKSYTERARNFRQHALQDQFQKVEGGQGLFEGATSAQALTNRAMDLYSVEGVSRMCYLSYRRGGHDASSKASCPAKDAQADNLLTWFTHSLNRHFPIYNEMTRHARYIDTQIPDDAKSTENQEVEQLDDEAGGPAITRLEPEFLLPIGGALVLGAFVGLGLLWAWVAYGARRLFYGELDAHADSLTVEEIVEHDVRKHTVATLATRAQYAFITESTEAHDVYRLSSKRQLRKLEKIEGDRPLLCTHLGDALRDDALRRCVLGVLEKLSKLPHGRVIVLSSVPIAKTRSAVKDQRTEEDDHRLIEFPFENDGESARWRSILAEFESVDVSIRGGFSSRLAPKASLTQLPDRNWLNEELGAIAGLSSLMGTDYETTLTRPLTRREVVKEIGKRADWFYRSLWDNCSTDEKIVLTQLSREGVVNPRQVNAVRSLLARGLLRMDPVLKPINNSFGRYVASVFDAEEIDALESAGQTAGFNMRRVLMGLILLVLLFLWFTQRDVVDTWITYLGGIAVGMTSVLKIMDSLKGGASSR